MYKIENCNLTVLIQEKGAAFWSIKDSAGMEYLWQGDPKYWSNRAPNLFPYIGRLTSGRYVLDNKSYKMDIHGFAKDMTYEEEQISTSCIRFWIRDTKETREQYPYRFRYGVEYELEENNLHVTYFVYNEDEKVMYFGVGAHPGFRVPLAEGMCFEDYYLEFDTVKAAKRIVLSEDCFVTDEAEEFPLVEGKCIPLHHHLFDRDAIVLRDMSRSITLGSKKDKRKVKVVYPDMPYLAIWHASKTDAPYVCIEPWSSLPSRKGIVEDFAKQENLITLEAGSNYRNRISICIEGTV